MCGTVGQMELDFGERFSKPAYSVRNGTYKEVISAIKNKSPRSYRIGSDSDAVILKLNGDMASAELATFRWWEKKKNGNLWPVFNVRAEGGFINKTNDPNYRGPYLIYNNPYVKSIIYRQRCLVPVDYFVEQPEDKKIKKKFIIRRQDLNPFFLGGVFKEVVDVETGEVKSHFAIITTPCNKVTQLAMHARSPLLIEDHLIDTYLDSRTSEDRLNEFFVPFQSKGFECFEVDRSIAKIKNHSFEANDPSYIKAKGPIMRIND